MAYAMPEVQAVHLMCERERYHFAPSLIPFVPDPDTGAALPGGARSPGDRRSSISVRGPVGVGSSPVIGSPSTGTTCVSVDA